MKRVILKHHKIRIVFRWVARIISGLAITYYLFMVIGGLISDFEPETITFEGVLVVGFAVVLLLSILFAWWKEEIGGLILIISSVAFAVFIYISAGNYKLLASVFISLPFSLSGILFLIAGRVEKN